MQTFTTNHGTSVTAETGEFVVIEYYKGFVNAVWVYTDRSKAEYLKSNREFQHSHDMQKNFHWAIKVAK